MVDVFISYSRGNQDAVRRLAEAVKQLGYVVWWDDELPPHLSYGDVITEKIGAAKAAIVVWSEGSISSEWVRAEADLARNQKKLIQTALDDCMPPMPFNQIQFASIGDWDGASDHPGWRKVMASLTALCGPPPAEAATGARPAPTLPPPLPEVPPPAPQVPPAPAPQFAQPVQPTQPTQPVIVLAPASGRTNTILVAAIAASLAVILLIGGIALFRNRAPATAAPVNAVAAAAAPGNVQDDAASASGEGEEEAGDDPASADSGYAAVGGDPPETIPGSDSRRLTEDDIEGLGAAQLRLARNEIYARHGRTFADPALRAHFSRYSWYEPTSSQVALSAVEQANVEFLQAAEAR